MSTKMLDPQQFSVLNLPVHLCSDYTGWLVQRLEQKAGTHVVTLNAEMVMLAEQDAALAEIIRAADLVIPDGAGVVLYLRSQGKRQSRCPGIELAESLIKQLGASGHTICFYGGQPGVAHSAAQAWQQKIPGASIITNHGYLTPPEQQHWQQVLQDKQPQLVLVGLGVPRQELWIRQNRFLCPESVWIGVGGSFDIWAGSKARAPKLFRENNLEWLYRLYQEPWRWRRMMVLPQFFVRAFSSKS